MTVFGRVGKIIAIFEAQNKKLEWYHTKNMTRRL